MDPQVSLLAEDQAATIGKVSTTLLLLYSMHILATSRCCVCVQVSVNSSLFKDNTATDSGSAVILTETSKVSRRLL
jgi:hypothetical protein